MSRNLFALERPRKISIAIPGYDGNALMKAQSQRAAEKKARMVRAEKVARDQRVATAIARAIVDDATALADLEQLNELTRPTVSTEVLSDLMLALELPVAGDRVSKGDL